MPYFRSGDMKCRDVAVWLGLAEYWMEVGRLGTSFMVKVPGTVAAER
jgi:hypothetical protein